MNKKKFSLLIILFPVFAHAGSETRAANLYEMRFEGMVKAINQGCAADAGPCSITVDNTQVIYGRDTRGEKAPKPWGQVDQKLFKGNPIRKKVWVYCLGTKEKTKGFCTLEGNTEYFIRLHQKSD